MLTTHEAAIWWRTLDAPHTAEAVDAPTLAPVNGSFPRRRSLYCCGFQWENTADMDGHRECCHS